MTKLAALNPKNSLSLKQFGILTVSLRQVISSVPPHAVKNSIIIFLNQNGHFERLPVYTGDTSKCSLNMMNCFSLEDASLTMTKLADAQTVWDHTFHFVKSL